MQHSAAWQGPPKQMLGPPTVDDKKLLWLPEPRRASTWLRMYFVACNGSFIRFEDFYESYCRWFEPIMTENSPKTPATPLESPTSEGKQQVELERQPQDQRMEEADKPEQQAPKEHLQETETEQRPTRLTAAPFPTRVEFLRVLTSTFHAARFYDPSGRVASWSSDEIQCRACSKYLVSDVCYRKEPLTFASTNRGRNLRRLEKYKDQGDIVYPEGDPAKLNTFAKKLAEDHPLFMLPQGTRSPWREREMRRMKVRSRYKAVEESAFPGVSLKEKVFSVPKKLSRPARKPRIGADERLAAGNGKGKQKKDSLEPQMVDLASSTMPTADLPNASRTTAPRRNSAPANLADILPSSSAQSTAPSINDTGLEAVAANVGNVQEFAEAMGLKTLTVNVGNDSEFAEAVRRHNSSVIAANGAAIPEELVGEFEKLGIQADFPQWKKGKKQ